MCRAVALLENQTSVRAYLNVMRTWMKDTTSLVAISLVSGRVIGVAVTRINSDSDKSDTYNRVQVRFRCNLIVNLCECNVARLTIKTFDLFFNIAIIENYIQRNFLYTKGKTWRHS